MLRQTLLALFILVTSAFVFAQEQNTDVGSYPVVAWTSKAPDDKIKIENGTGANLSVMINVNDDGQEGLTGGITVVNCGNTKRIEAGSSALCVTNSVTDPVMFSSDGVKPVSGTYQIKQQLPTK